MAAKTNTPIARKNVEDLQNITAYCRLGLPETFRQTPSDHPLFFMGQRMSTDADTHRASGLIKSAKNRYRGVRFANRPADQRTIG